MSKTETVEEFLARGGKKVVVPAIVPSFKQRINHTGRQVVVIMDLDEGAHFFSEIKPDKKTKSKKSNKKDFSALPEHLRKLVGDIE